MTLAQAGFSYPHPYQGRKLFAQTSICSSRAFNAFLIHIPIRDGNFFLSPFRGDTTIFSYPHPYQGRKLGVASHTRALRFSTFSTQIPIRDGNLQTVTSSTVTSDQFLAASLQIEVDL